MTERSEIKDLIEKAYAARVEGDLDTLMTYFHPDCRFQLMGAAEREAICRPLEGCVAVRGQMAEFIGAFTFANFETLDVVVEGDRILAALQKLLVQDVEHLQERHVLGDALEQVGEEGALVGGVLLAPDLEGEVHYL